MRVLILLFLSSTIYAQTQLGDILNKANEAMKARNTAGLSDSKIANGLTEALRVSTTKAVAAVGRPDGFLKKRGDQDPAAGETAPRGNWLEDGRHGRAGQRT